MMSCEKNGTCYNVKNQNYLASLVESFEAGSPFSAFLLAAEICLCLLVLASIPNTRKDAIFWFLATVFAPFLVKTVVEVAFFIAIYFYTDSYTFWSWVHDSVISFCYTSFLFNFEYGMVFYALQTVRVAMKKSPVSKGYTRWPYLIIFLLTLVQSALFWQIAILGMVSVLLILVLAPLAILASLIATFAYKTNKVSEWEQVRNVKSRMLWNIPCLILTMADTGAQLYLTTQSDSNKINAFHNKGLLFSILFPAVAVFMMFLTLSSLRKAIFPCCYNETVHQSDRMFLIPRESISSGSPIPSERSSISSSTQPIITYPPNSVVPYNSIAPMYPYFSMPTGYPAGCQIPQMPQGFQGQPMFVPIPMTFYNSSHMQQHHRPSELPMVQ